IADLHDTEGRVTLPGFYDRVRPLSEGDRNKIASLNISDAFYIKTTGTPKLWGEKGFTTLERAGARPTLDVNGLYSGFIGEGSKTIIPAYAKAKISCRLVPYQDPDEVHKQLILYLETHMPDTITWNVTMLSGAPAYLCENAPGLDRFVKALEASWGKPVAYKREGGSIPVATSMKEILGVDSILTGFGLPDDHIHSPNERLHLPTWKRGIKALILFILSFNNHN
ncbi:MAG: M20/M25/M40 family metallo-hydrolase, partial [Chloroflexota bacterium]